MCYDVVGLVAYEYVDDVLCLKAFLDGVDDAEDEEQFVACFYSFARMESVVALAAVVGFVFFSEVMEEELPSADGCLGVCCCLL